MAKHEAWELKQMQAMPLGAKVRMTERRINDWYDHWGGQVYVSFSGGKDSTVLLHIARSLHSDIEAVFVDTGLEYPEIRQFVNGFDNVTWLRPEMSFKRVVQEYGYPFFGKEISRAFYEYQTCKKETTRQKRHEQIMGEWLGPDGKISRYNYGKYKGMLEAPFRLSHRCCDVMKKNPTKKFVRESGKKPMTAQLASESLLRQAQWIKNGCNGFDMKSPVSNPMAFWTEQDVLHYIKLHDLKLASVYGDIVIKNDDPDEIEGQITVQDILGIYEGEKLTTTGCKRTGCMFCGFGCQINGDKRFLDMKRTHPRQYDFIFKPESEGGLGYAEKIDYINEHCNTNIKY